ncbi:putative glycosyl transferase, family 14, beta-glucuronosyltransferase GlcAT14A/B/C [Helianthus annuus]|uniref:Glycosyl transferase, family 14 n=1 Tax=Helianthus annuus TaxID=4232 RepID=A0A251UZZ5_HELAN|nr:putative glycosyl transferase, family 14 [Helianthus annuus]KAJ0581648.1 putative glycosyl transferase, family 14, beta-glucuronosyltransferase GlcAT14A/B/C [Helianthus annuus]KAJ0597616.1 putative glycosyl transferase, family 14, beta-glucuronosyltransferase GlcAT14A/B/C [Helianthus annuus]KAJ0758260.1 putative glycosyl transferase, family 14, beta-glucuronosyltransferase GlcAT14A/B/C [Helianthus annuus]KAJ0761920.1 putative glycosyl transferase, family 14, beta-glucuronosyltransferase GlcA
MVSNTLRACAILLKKFKDWDWFINLSASDYPLVTQDDLLFIFCDLKRDLNFIKHTSKLGWKELILSCICPCCFCVTVIVELAIALIKAPFSVMKWFTEQIPC